MAEKQSPIFYTHKDLATLLVKDADVHEGHWGIDIELSFAGATVPLARPDNTMVLMPAGIVGISKIGIRKHDSANPLTVDAALVNPVVAPSSRPPKTGKKPSSV